MDRWQAQQAFWSSFGVPAFQETEQPDVDDFPFPYITYQAAAGGFNTNIFVNASIWTKAYSWDTADALSDAIEKEIGYGGKIMPYDGGIIWITAENNFSQNMGDLSDNLIKRKLLSVALRYA